MQCSRYLKFQHTLITPYILCLKVLKYQTTTINFIWFVLQTRSVFFSHFKFEPQKNSLFLGNKVHL